MDLLSSFRGHLRAAGEAPPTIELYSRSVRYSSRWLVAHDRRGTWDELTRHSISAWLAELAETCEPSTVGTRLRGMRRLCRWLVTEGELEVAPTDGIEISVPPEKPVSILTDDEIARLLKTCAVSRGCPGAFNRAVFLGRRDEVVLRLLLDTGVRVSGLCGLALTDIDLDRELADVTGKGSRPRVVPFGETATTATGVLRRAVAWFAARGVTVQRVLTDNGGAYRSHAWRDTCAPSSASRPERTRPHRPQTNGKFGRFHRTLADGWAFARMFLSESARRKALPTWLHEYNHHRPHTAIGCHPPITRLNNLPGQYTQSRRPSPLPGDPALPAEAQAREDQSGEHLRDQELVRDCLAVSAGSTISPQA